jgi:molybdenum cofactor cytidylyltransferase
MLPTDPTPARGTIAAIILAAGMSRRMGRLKMLLPFGDRPMLARVIESVLAAGESLHITVVTGHEEQEIRAVAVEYTGVVCAHNMFYAVGGMLSSVQTGIRALPGTCTAFLLVLGDQPMVRPETLNALLAAWHPESAPIVVPAYNGKRGHPVLISMRFAAEILALDEKDTLKTLLLRHADRLREFAIDDPATAADIDTPEDYEAALQRWRETEGFSGRRSSISTTSSGNRNS